MWRGGLCGLVHRSPMAVGTPAAALPGPISPPPDTRIHVSAALGALADSPTPSGTEAGAARPGRAQGRVVHVAVAAVQDQWEPPDIETALRPGGRVTVSVAAPVVAAKPTLATAIA